MFTISNKVVNFHKKYSRGFRYSIPYFNMYKLLLIILVVFVSPMPSFSAPRFFSNNSVWNLAIPNNAIFDTQPIGKVVWAGIDTWSDNAWSIPFYASKSSDGLHPILYNEFSWIKVFKGIWLRSGNSKIIEKEILSTSKPSFPYSGCVYCSTSSTSWMLPHYYNKTIKPNLPPAQYYFSQAMKPSHEADGHIAILQPAGRVLEAYAAIILSTGELVALSYSLTDPKSRGDGWQNGQTAAMTPNYAGLIWDDEIITGINHTMAVSLPASFLNPTVAYPAYTFDRGAMRESPPYTGSVPMGGRFALPPSLRISSLGLKSPEGMSIAKAAQKYGFIVTDRGGGGITLKVQPNSNITVPRLHSWNSELQADLLSIFANVRQVKFPIITAPH